MTANSDTNRNNGSPTIGQPAQEQHQASSEETKKSRTEKVLLFLLGGDYLALKKTRKLIPFILYICILVTLSINIRYQLEALSKEKIKLEENLILLKGKQIHHQQEYQKAVKITTIASKLDTIGVGLIAGPPYELQND